MRCPTCSRQFLAQLSHCPIDGTVLQPSPELPHTVVWNGGSTSGGVPVLPMLELPLTLRNRYVVDRMIGGGGMAQVYHAVDPIFENREVAIKVVLPSMRQESEFDIRFQREARILGQLNHPAIVTVYDFGIQPECGPFLVMEYLNGQTLRERLKESGPMPVSAALQMIAQVLEGLQQAHALGVVHRDIKPDNLFLLNTTGTRLHVKVLDFGIARMVEPNSNSPSDAKLTGTGAVLGTPKYMAPEQLAGLPVDHRADLYSLAVVLFEAISGQVPRYHGPALTTLCPQVPFCVQSFIQECMQIMPDRRPQTAAVMLQRLRALRDPRGMSLVGDSADLESSGRVATHRTPITGTSRAEVVGPNRLNRWQRLPVWGMLPMFLGLIVVVVFGSLRLVNWLATPANAVAESPQIGGISLAMSRSQVWERLGRPDHERDWLPTESGLPEPWNRNLQASDFFVRMPNRVIRMASWHRDCLQVLFDGEQVIGVRVESPEVATGPRGVMIGDDERAIDRRYPAVRPTMIDLPNGQFSMLLRYPDQGVAFEIHNRTVQAIALFPPLGSDRPPGE